VAPKGPQPIHDGVIRLEAEGAIVALDGHFLASRCEALSLLADVHRTHIGELELGHREPGLSMLLILADALKVPPSALVEGLFVPRERQAPTHSKGGRLVPLARGDHDRHGRGGAPHVGKAGLVASGTGATMR
jgi:hypothetical protein